jgi:hypothetical protein
MRSKLLVAVAALAATLAVASVAAAGMMHPRLAAHLSGMGEHGIVNFRSHETKGQLCWTFDVHLMHATGATIRDAHGMIVAHLGKKYKAKGCAMVGKKALQLVEAKPKHYRVWIATKGHPGELRGSLFAGMAHM